MDVADRKRDAILYYVVPCLRFSTCYQNARSNNNITFGRCYSIGTESFFRDKTISGGRHKVGRDAYSYRVDAALKICAVPLGRRRSRADRFIRRFLTGTRSPGNDIITRLFPVHADHVINIHARR